VSGFEEEVTRIYARQLIDITVILILIYRRTPFVEIQGFLFKHIIPPVMKPKGFSLNLSYEKI